MGHDPAGGEGLSSPEPAQPQGLPQGSHFSHRILFGLLAEQAGLFTGTPCAAAQA